MNSRITFCIVAVLAFFVLHPIAAHARIGETLAQCETRYGKTVKVTNGYHFFSKATMSIACKFINGACEEMCIFHSERDVLRHPTELSEVEIEALLEANSGGSVWSKGEAPSMTKEWKTADGLLVAAYFTFEHELVIVTKAEMDRRIAAKAAEEKAKLKGF